MDVEKMRELAALAARLTEAQRQAVLTTKAGLLPDYLWFEPMRNRTRRILNRLGLTMYAAAPDRLSTLGLAVRAHLQEQVDGN